MKYLICGAGGFLGSSVSAQIDTTEHEIFYLDKIPLKDRDTLIVDLSKQDEVYDVLARIRPDYIFQCAGMVEKTEQAMLANPLYTLNVLQALVHNRLDCIKKVIILGSAAEYGVLSDAGSAITEDAPLFGDDYYARSKILETSIALSFKKNHNLPIVVARLFTPIGPVETSRVSPGRLLIPNIFKQVEEVRQNKRTVIDAITRFEPVRDYIDVRDVATSLLILAHAPVNRHDVYNIGSGVATSNKQIVDALLEVASLDRNVTIIESRSVPEPLRAGQADISRMKDEYGWQPTYVLSESIHSILYGY